MPEISGGAATAAILGYVTLQRLMELAVARRNTARLLRQGAAEHSPGHYPLIVLVHAGWLVALWFTAFGEPVSIPILLIFGLTQLLRFWTLASLGSRWTTRIIVRPGEKLVARGPYRFIRHPNYVVVVLEIALLPAVFGLWGLALLFSLLNAAVLAVRIRAENAALASIAGSHPPPHGEEEGPLSRGQGG